MREPQISESLQRQLTNSADVHRVYGSPVSVGEKTIIPIAHVSCGYRGGVVSRGEGHESGGGGGSIEARPVGVIEVSQVGARFVPVFDPAVVFSAARAAVIGLVIGLILPRRRH